MKNKIEEIKKEFFKKFPIWFYADNQPKEIATRENVWSFIQKSINQVVKEEDRRIDLIIGEKYPIGRKRNGRKTTWIRGRKQGRGYVEISKKEKRIVDNILDLLTHTDLKGEK